jgi:hypothetical protein
MNVFSGGWWRSLKAPNGSFFAKLLRFRVPEQGNASGSQIKRGRKRRQRRENSESAIPAGEKSWQEASILGPRMEIEISQRRSAFFIQRFPECFVDIAEMLRSRGCSEETARNISLVRTPQTIAATWEALPLDHRLRVSADSDLARATNAARAKEFALGNNGEAEGGCRALPNLALEATPTSPQQLQQLNAAVRWKQGTFGATPFSEFVASKLGPSKPSGDNLSSSPCPVGVEELNSQGSGELTRPPLAGTGAGGGGEAQGLVELRAAWQNMALEERSRYLTRCTAVQTNAALEFDASLSDFVYRKIQPLTPSAPVNARSEKGTPGEST